MSDRLRRSAGFDDVLALVDTEVDRRRADGSVPGLTIAVTDRDGTLFDRVYGLAEVASGRPVQRDTLFEIGSIGKTFTAIVVMQLAEEGRLGLVDPVVTHLPWFRVPRTGPRITIRHLLGHTAGITAGIEGTPEAAFQVWRLRDLWPGSGPGRRFHYSNVGYKALGLIIEAIERESYPAVIRRRILEPLRMANTEPETTNTIRPRMAVGYAPASDDRPWSEGAPLLPATWVETGTADGCLVSTGADMAVFARMILRGGEAVDGTRLLPAAAIDAMATPVRARAADGYGMGLITYEVDGHRYVGHTGGMIGSSAGMWSDPIVGLAAVVFQNGLGHSPFALARLAIRAIAALREGRDPREAAPVVASRVPTGDDEPARGDGGRDADAGTTGAGAGGRASAEPPDALRVIAGHYRSHDPWTTNFRVVLRGDVPWLCFPAAIDGFDDEQPLHPIARGGYRVGDDPLGPERLRFDTIIDGRARRAWLSGWDYYRVGDP